MYKTLIAVLIILSLIILLTITTHQAYAKIQSDVIIDNIIVNPTTIDLVCTDPNIVGQTIITGYTVDIDDSAAFDSIEITDISTQTCDGVTLNSIDTSSLVASTLYNLRLTVSTNDDGDSIDTDTFTTLSPSTTYSLILSESLSIDDTVDTTTHYKIILSDSISIGDSVTAVKITGPQTFEINLSDGLSIGDSSSTIHTIAPVIYQINLSDGISIGDSVNIIHNSPPVIYQLTLSDGLSVGDSITVIHIPFIPGPQTYQLFLSESIGILDSVTINGEIIIPPEPEPEPVIFKKRGGDDKQKTRPTFGLDHTIDGKQIVQNGFIINNRGITITNNFHTEVPIIELKVGELNVLSAKSYSSRGLKEVEFIFGIPEVGKHYEAEAAVEVWLDNRTPSIVINQEDSFIRGNVTALKTEAKCNPRDQTICENITLFIIFDEAPLNSVFAIQAIDLAGRFIISTINDGVIITGDSLNPPKTEYMAQGKKGLVLLTQIDKRNNLWVDAEGIEYTKNRMETWIRLTPWPMPNPVDNWKVEDRYISYWHEKILYEQAKAKYVFNSEAIQN